MELFGDEARIQQGEDMTFDRVLSQAAEEYVPFIISSERENPFFVVTVASTKFEKNQRYVESWWEDLKDQPRFYSTVPFPIGELLSKPNTKADLTINVPSVGTDAPMQSLYEYTLPGSTQKYWVYIEDLPGEPINHDYECRLRFNITSLPNGDKPGAGTSNWGSQNYLYQVTLVSGELMHNVIKEAHVKYPDLPWPMNWPPQNTPEEDRFIQNRVRELYDFVKLRVKDFFQPDIDWDSPLGRIWVPQVILPPTQLQVDNNLRVII